jgi:CheY-like chemotaxis protein
VTDAGLRVFGEGAFDLVVCDLFMPVKEGLETIRELKQMGDVKVIAVSGAGRWARPSS